MALIDKSYFVGEINIPDTGSPAVSERLNLFIEKYEKEFLLQAMGIDLYTAYADGILVTPTPDQKWIDIRDGVSYTSGGKNYKWDGLRTEVLPAASPNPATYISPIANYIFYKWLRRDNKAKPDDAEKQSAYYTERAQNMVDAWNEMAEQVRSFTFFLNQNTETYTEWVGFNWYFIYYNHSLSELLIPINSMNL